MIEFFTILFGTTTILLALVVRFGLKYIKHLVSVMNYQEAKLKFIANTKAEVLDAIKEYTERVESTHGDLKFYGDQSLQRLIKHGNGIVDMLENYEKEFYEFLEDDSNWLPDNYEEDEYEENEKRGQQ